MKPLNGHSGTDGFAVADSLLKTLDLDSIGSLLSLGADVVLLVDQSAIVSQVYFANGDLSDYGLSKTIGKRLQDCVTIESVPGGPLGTLPSSRVTVVISWKLPTEPAADPRHEVTVVTQIK